MNAKSQEYIQKFIDLMKGELGADNVKLDEESNSLLVGWDVNKTPGGVLESMRINLDNIADCYMRTKQEVLFEVNEKLQEVPINNDNDVLAMTKAKKVLNDLIRNTAPNE